MTKSICTIETNGTAPIYEPAKANHTRKKSIQESMMRLAGTIGAYAVDVYRYNNDPEPVFANGGTRVLLRPDRIDLV